MNAPEIACDASWMETIRQSMPAARVAPAKTRRLLVYSQCEGYPHWVRPHTSAMLGIMGEQSGAFQMQEVQTLDELMAALPECDGLVFNNTCAKRQKRDLFADLLGDPEQSLALQRRIITHIAEGHGYIGLHGACCAFMQSPEWEEMQGTSFDYHPPQQEVTLRSVDPKHPLTEAFGDEPFVHYDEPYILTRSFGDLDITPLLAMDLQDMTWRTDRPPAAGPCYAAYIRQHHQGRVFYCSPSHNAQSFADKRLLQFMLDGIQYSLGDLTFKTHPVQI